MKLRTDDDIYRARLVYLGPPGYPLPFRLPYAQYGLFVVVAAVYLTIGVLIGGWMAGGVALCAAAFSTACIWQQVDPDRPARKVIKVALVDWRRVDPKPEQLPRLTARHIRFSTITRTTGERR